VALRCFPTQRIPRRGLEEHIMNSKGPLRLGTVAAACKLVGGDKPIHKTTYYRGVKLGIYPAPFRATPNSARVDLDKLESAIRALADCEVP
jgi:hypothetical protein